MEINGRECKEVKIGEHTYWFIEKYKGKEIRVVMELTFGDDLKIKKKSLIDKTPELFVLLCRRIDDDIVPTVAFLDDAEPADYVEIQNIIIEGVDELFTQTQ